MDTIMIIDLTQDTYTNAAGHVLYCHLKKYFDDNTMFQLSFHNVSAISSSFFNSSFGELIDNYGIDKFKKLLKPVNITKSQYNLIVGYIERSKERKDLKIQVVSNL